MAFFAILSFPVEARILGPIEVSDIFDAASKDVVMNSLEEFLLINLDGYEGLNFSTDKFVRKLITAHSGQIVHHAIYFNILLLEHLSSLSAALKALSDLLCENLLNTEQGNLGLVFVDELDKTHLESLNCTVLANGAHGSLHGNLKLAEPVFNIALALDIVIKVDCLS